MTDWREVEGIDFYLVTVPGAAFSGVRWIRLTCSLCGPVQATAEGKSTDLGYLSTAAQSHLERKHAELVEPAAAQLEPYRIGDPCGCGCGRTKGTPHPYCVDHDQPLDWCHHDADAYPPAASPPGGFTESYGHTP